jgi:DNA anti-recombination protein RmuC
MKRILITCCILTASFSLSMAQQAAKAPAAKEQAADSKLSFSSRMNEMDAHISRNNKELAQKAYVELAGMMQNKIAELNRKGTAESAATAKTLQGLYSDIKMLSVDMTKNRAAIKDKLDAFLARF